MGKMIVKTIDKKNTRFWASVCAIFGKRLVPKLCSWNLRKLMVPNQKVKKENTTSIIA